MSIKKLKLSKGLFATIDEIDFERASQFKWSASQESHKGTKWYAVRREKGVKIRLHRFICGLEKTDPLVVDHIDGDGLDNRRSNLRVCTQKENMQHAAKRRKENKK